MNDSAAVQKLYRHMSLEICALEARREYRRALDVLQEFWNRHADEDKTDWLRNAILSRQADILTEMGDLHAALEKRRLVTIRPANRAAYMVHSQSIALLLRDLDQPRQALEELRHMWSVLSRPEEGNDLGPMVLYFELSEMLGEKVSEEHKRMARQILKKAEVPFDSGEDINLQVVIHAMSIVRQRNLQASRFNEGTST